MTTTEMLKRDVKVYAESIEEAVRTGEIEDYLSEVYDAEITSTLYGEYRGVKIALALGGPNIFFDTRSGYVKGYWGTSQAEYHVKSFACNAVDNYFDMQWENGRY